MQALAIHGGYPRPAYRGEAEYETIRRVKQHVSIPVIANGDIDSPQKARRCWRIRGPMRSWTRGGHPWIFREIENYHKSEPEMEEIRAIMIEHLDNLYAFYGEYTGVRVARKHIAWYARGTATAPVPVAGKPVRIPYRAVRMLNECIFRGAAPRACHRS